MNMIFVIIGALALFLAACAFGLHVAELEDRKEAEAQILQANQELNEMNRRVNVYYSE